MDNLLNYPATTIVNRVVPKTMFYKFMEVNQHMKTRFVNDIVNITWLYKLSASSLNVTDSEDMKEIEVFVVNLKQPDCPTDLFTFIDTNMPHHIVFILLNDANAMLLVNYKEWTDSTHTKFRITHTFVSPWMSLSELSLGEHQAGTMGEIVKLKQAIAKAESDLQALQKKMRREPQLDIQIKMNNEVKAKRKALEALKQQLLTLK